MITDAKTPVVVVRFQYMPQMMGAAQMPSPPNAKRMIVKIEPGFKMPMPIAMMPSTTVTTRDILSVSSSVASRLRMR